MSVLKIYNTLAREKQPFFPIEPGKVRMYVCGMTVYDYCHLGHARVMVVFDMVQRWLRAAGFEVTYVRNITDIDDKIIKRAVENGETIAQLTQRFITAMDEDAAALGVQKPDHEPRATAYVPQMLGLIETLEQKGLAYQASDGDVNYSVRDFPGYGKLSGKSLDDLRAGERVDVNTGKRDPLDFVLWKASKESEPDEVKWDLALGSRAPRLAYRMLGDGVRTARASSSTSTAAARTCSSRTTKTRSRNPRARSGHPFVNYWMHNGFVRVDNEKMSKSLGNFFTIRDVLQAVRCGSGALFHPARALPQPAELFRRPSGRRAPCIDALVYRAQGRRCRTSLPLDPTEAHALRFAAAMNDDFNTALALSVLFDLANEINRTGSAALARQLKRLAALLGLLERSAARFPAGPQGGQRRCG